MKIALLLAIFVSMQPAFGAGKKCANGFKNMTLRDQLTVAAVAYEQSGSVTEEVLFEKMEAHIERAVQSGSEWVVFPELITLDLLPRDLAEAEIPAAIRNIYPDFTPRFKNKMIELAAKHNVYLLTGSTPLVEDTRIYNATYFISPGGRVVEQRKIFMTPFEQRWEFSPGEELKVFETPWGRAAILICLDCEMPVLSNLLAQHRVEIILVPSMTERIEGYRRVRFTAQARAIEHRAFVVHVGVTGSLAHNWPNHGVTSVLTPSEDGLSGTLAEGSGQPDEVLVQQLNLGDLRRRRQSGGVDPANGQNQRREPLNVRVEVVE